ncbi:MAG: flagellin [Rhizomicrobium sp.]
MLSINTNTGSMTALRYLNKTNSGLNGTETKVSTGLKVASARDDGSTYAIAQNMRGDIGGGSAIEDSLNRGLSAIDVATSAGESISDLLIEMKAKALAASDSSLDTASREAYNQDFMALRDQIATVVSNATFNGLNLLNGSTTKVTALASSSGSRRITVLAQNYTFGGSILAGMSAASTISTMTNAANMVSIITTALVNVDSSLSKLSAGAKKYSIQLTFTSKLIDSLQTGVGNLVDADMATESANLTALQTKQQLGVQALSIANTSPQIILSLFQ